MPFGPPALPRAHLSGRRLQIIARAAFKAISEIPLHGNLAAKATQEYEAERRAVGAKTERLRALRLAKEAAEKSEEAATKPPTSSSDAKGGG